MSKSHAKAWLFDFYTFTLCEDLEDLVDQDSRPDKSLDHTHHSLTESRCKLDEVD